MHPHQRRLLHSASPLLQGEASLSQTADKPSAEGSYQYQPLPSHEHFRILELLPDEAIGRGGGNVRCRLHTERLSDAEDKYTAISYVWGDPENRVPVVCDGSIVDVTASLADALRHIRDHTKHRFVWADAVCINQQDDLEKGHQVKRMGKVYENAMEVVVWLGKDDEDIAEDCFNLILETNEYLDHQLEIYGDIQDIPLITPESPISFEKSRWDKVKKLAHLPWFDRLWVLQESALARQCQLLWGKHQTTLAEICETSFFLVHRAELFNLVGGQTIGNVATNFISQSTYQPAKSWMGAKPLIKEVLKNSQRGMLFLNILDLGRTLNVSFNVDRVYAFLGNPLARKHEEQALLVEPDYSKSVMQVYFEVACELLAHPREAPYLLSQVDHHDSDCVEGLALGTDSTLPSWVPRWDKGRRQISMSDPSFWYRAGGRRNFEATVQNDNSLLLPTIIFDRLVWTSDVIDSDNLLLNPDGWDRDTKTSKKPFIDLLFTSVQQAFRKHCPGRKSQHRNMAFQLAFSLTIVQQYSNLTSPDFDLIKHQREFSAYLQAAQQLAGTSTKKRMSRVAQKLSASFRRSAKLSRLPHSLQNIGNTSPFIYEGQLYGTDNRRFVITKNGRFGLVPCFAQPNDVCCICPGMKVPLILGPREDDRYGLVGDSYIHGVMGGEVMEQVEKGEVKLENIVLV